MEECTTSLGDMIMSFMEDCEGRFSPTEILKVVVGVAKALKYLHDNIGLLHGDLKSHNILIQG